MDKKLIIFGANGALGKGVTNTLLSKDFDEVYLFASKFDEKYSDSKIKLFVVKDLSIEKNVMASLYDLKTDKNTQLLLYSTIGGFYGGTSVWETEEIDFDRMINMNLKTNFLIAKQFSLLIKKSYGGSICFTSAYTANHPEALKFAYGVSKSALNYLVKTLSLEGSDINLSVNAIAPFIIDTPANREWMKNANYSSWMKPEEIGELIYSLFQHYNFMSGNIIELKKRFNS
ncbi:MAG: SDR family NAD(P)-dependent oxidoreductase [Ignavibacteria bacterium]|nr:SDR family NAD(P)-dependent oxidoreductase [Ignavibacteria bacterium]